MSSVGAESVTIEEAIDAALRASAVITTAGGRVYPDLAPENVDYPVFVYQQQSTTDVVGLGPRARIMVNADWIVRVISEAASYAVLKPYARAIDLALDGMTFTAPDGQVFACVRQSEYRMTEQGGQGTTIRHLGGTFRLQAQTR